MKTFPAGHGALGEGGKSRLLLGKPFWSQGVGISHQRSLGTEGHGSTRAAVPRATAAPLRAHLMLEMAVGNELTLAKPTTLRWEEGAGCAGSSRGTGGCSTPAEPQPSRAERGERSKGGRCEELRGQKASSFPEIPTGIPVCPLRKDCPLRWLQPNSPCLLSMAVTKHQLLHRALRPPSCRGMPGLAETGWEKPGISPALS